MQLIYNNFDGLDITFQGSLPEKVLNKLSNAKNQAQNEKRSVLIELGGDNGSVMVAETGASGGYRYRFDTGMDGEVWFIAHSTNSEGYNIRVSAKSLALALHGYEEVKGRILNRLETLEAMGKGRHNDAGKVINTPLERISRFDYCFDFIMGADFKPTPDRFVAHQRAKKHVYGEHGVLPSYSSSNGDKINTIRIGEMPNRQIAIYNKTKEIKSNAKQYWWDIWGIDEKSFKESFKQIWRIEVRAGKTELDKWPLKRFKEFEDKAGDVTNSILKAIRYTDPLKGDLNRSRWPIAPIWQKSIDTSYKALAPYSTNAIRENIVRDYRENVVKGYRDRLIGNTIGMTAAQGRDISELTIVLEEVLDVMATIVKGDPETFTNKLKKAEDRYSFIE